MTQSWCWCDLLPDENEAEMTEKAAGDEADSGNSDDDGADDDDDEGVITEVRFVPSDKAAREWSRQNWRQPDVSQNPPGIFSYSESILIQFYTLSML